MRFGLLGTGPWAHQTVAPGLSAHRGVELVGVWGRDREKAARLADEHGVRAWEWIDDLLAEVDAVAVALPPAVQADVALRAARSGCHLLLDKPLAVTTHAAAAIAAEVGARGLASVVFFTSRFVPEIERFMANAAETGGWTEARIDRLHSIFTPDNAYGASPWRRGPRGGLWDVGPHALSIVLPVLGAVERVSAMDGPRDTTHVLLRHAGGAVSTLTLSLDAPAGAVREHAVFIGESGTATVPVVAWTPVQAYQRALDVLVDAAGGGAKPTCDVGFGATVVRVLAAAEESAHTGEAVNLG